MTAAAPGTRNQARRLLGAGGLASVPWIADFASRFFTTVILARFLSPRELGIAVAISVLLALAWLLSDLGIDQFLMSRTGDGPEPLAAAHSLHLGKGVVVCAGLLVAAPAIAPLFGAAGHAASFRWCAVIVLVYAFTHLGVKQARRDFRYLPEVKTVLLSRAAGLASAYPAVLVFHDHRAMITSLVVTGAVAALASHAFAPTPYRLSVRNRRILGEALSYGWPLTLNGLGIAANSQLDRALVGYWLGLATLASFAVMLNLAAAPIAVTLGVLGTLGLPFLARADDRLEARGTAYLGVVWVHAVAAAAYALFISATLDTLVPWIYGGNYRVGPNSLCLIALLAWVRLNRGAPTLRLLAEADTVRLTVANLAAASGLAVAVGLLALAPSLDSALTGILVGDVLSLAVFLHAATRNEPGLRSRQLRELCWSLVPAMAAAAAIFAAPGAVATRLAVFGAAAFLIALYAVLGFRRYFVRAGLLAIFADAIHEAPAAATGLEVSPAGISANE